MRLQYEHFDLHCMLRIVSRPSQRWLTLAPLPCHVTSDLGLCGWRSGCVEDALIDHGALLLVLHVVHCCLNLLTPIELLISCVFLLLRCLALTGLSLSLVLVFHLYT